MLPFLITAVNEVLSSIFFLFGYVSNTNSFPQPLSAEEETKFIELYKNGSDDARNTLIERNLRLVAHIVKKYSTFGNDCDDLISIGTIGLIKAITTFDQSKGTRLATYAARCIENAILSQWPEGVLKKVRIQPCSDSLIFFNKCSFCSLGQESF